MFNSGGGAWVSQDSVTWKYKAVSGARVPVAPHVVKYNGAFYMSGNSSPLYRAPSILGPYELAGPWLDDKGQPWQGVSNGKPWRGAFDVDIFVDDDNKPYLYFPGRSTDGIYVVPLDPKNLNHFAAAPKHLFSFDASHTWEHWGEANEYSKRCLDRGTLGGEAPRHLLSGVQRVGHAVDSVTRPACIPERAPWARSSIRL